jgi:hypothetical protein
MRTNESVGRTRSLAGGVAFALLLLSSGSASNQPVPGPQPVPAPQGFEYAAKFICGPVGGKGAPGVVAPGQYFTAINVHNPSNENFEFVKKIAVALPSEKAGRVSGYFAAKLAGDQALEIDCPDILRHLDVPPQQFTKGFVVIKSRVELDVIAVYTAAGAPAGAVVTLELERVPARKFP